MYERLCWEIGFPSSNGNDIHARSEHGFGISQQSHEILVGKGAANERRDLFRCACQARGIMKGWGVKRVPTLVGMDDHHHDAIIVATS